MADFLNLFFVCHKYQKLSWFLFICKHSLFSSKSLETSRNWKGEGAVKAQNAQIWSPHCWWFYNYFIIFRLSIWMWQTDFRGLSICSLIVVVTLRGLTLASGLWTASLPAFRSHNTCGEDFQYLWSSRVSQTLVKSLLFLLTPAVSAFIWIVQLQWSPILLPAW